MSLLLLPAVDVSQGHAVWPGPIPGKAAASSIELVPVDPLALAQSLVADGAEWIHLVDLDAAYGRGSNAPLLRRIIALLPVPVQLSGGVRDRASLRDALDLGPARVNLATSALLDLSFVEESVAELGEQVAVGLDVRDGRLCARGTGEDAGEPREVLPRLDAAGARRYVVTDVDSDRALSGANLDLLRKIAGQTDRPLLASGGVGALADIAALAAEPTVEGVVLGTALAAGRFDLAAALHVARDGRSPAALPPTDGA